MQIVNLSIDEIITPQWNANDMQPEMKLHLRRSIERFGVVVPLVVREIGEGKYETIGGAQRLVVLRDLGIKDIPCIVVELDDNEARLLSQALNRIAGTDNLGLRAELLRELLGTIPEQDILSILPETSESLKAFASLGKDNLLGYMENFQQAEATKLKHLQFQLTTGQLKVIEEALARMLPEANRKRDESPNTRGTALYLICKWYLEKGDKNE